MTTDAALFVPKTLIFRDLTSLYLLAFPAGIVEASSPNSIQLLHRERDGYVEIVDSSLSGNGLDDCPEIWEKNGEPPADALYCASPGFFEMLGRNPKQISVWGNPRDFV